LESIRGSVLWPTNLVKYGFAWSAYAKIAVKLRVYELYLGVRRQMGMSASPV
jgi:aarF domain-containing kinase